MMGKLFDKFAKIVVEYPDADICVLYNSYIQTLTDNEVEFMSSNCPMFLRIVFGIRRAPSDIKETIKNFAS